MGRISRFPILYDSVEQISITALKELGFLLKKTKKYGQLIWKKNNEEQAWINITVNTNCEEPFILLEYNYNQKPIKYKVMLLSYPSNLGKGKIWYFLCPYTKKKCRKLYLIDGYFLHREAFDGCMYECQTQSKMFRNFVNTYGNEHLIKELFDQLNQKHFKKTYAGRPTKKYLKIIRKIEKYGGIQMIPDEFNL